VHETAGRILCKRSQEVHVEVRTSYHAERATDSLASLSATDVLFLQIREEDMFDEDLWLETLLGVSGTTHINALGAPSMYCNVLYCIQ
jgi:hypothetical protein